MKQRYYCYPKQMMTPLQRTFKYNAWAFKPPANAFIGNSRKPKSVETDPEYLTRV